VQRAVSLSECTVVQYQEYGAVQLNVGQIDENGVYAGGVVSFAINGFMRIRGESDACLSRMMSEKDLLTFLR